MDMNASEYQKLAARTLVDKPGFEISDRDMMLVWCALGLAGESGEAADHIKKGVFHQHGVDLPKLKKELGDVLWYAAGVATVAGFDMGEIMQENIDKLRLRYPDGFNAEDSIKRVDVNQRYTVVRMGPSGQWQPFYTGTHEDCVQNAIEYYLHNNRNCGVVTYEDGVIFMDKDASIDIPGYESAYMLYQVQLHGESVIKPEGGE